MYNLDKIIEEVSYPKVTIGWLQQDSGSTSRWLIGKWQTIHAWYCNKACVGME